MKTRPWIWVIVANVLFISGTISLVVIAVRNRPLEVPVEPASAPHGH